MLGRSEFSAVFGVFWAWVTMREDQRGRTTFPPVEVSYLGTRCVTDHNNEARRGFGGSIGSYRFVDPSLGPTPSRRMLSAVTLLGLERGVRRSIWCVKGRVHGPRNKRNHNRLAIKGSVNIFYWVQHQHQAFILERITHLEACVGVQGGNEAGYGTQEVQPGFSIIADMEHR